MTLNYASSQTNGKPRTAVVVLAGILSALVLLGGLTLVLCGFLMYDDPYTRAAADKLWAASAVVSGGLLFVASVLALTFISSRRMMVRKWTLVAIALSIACSVWSLIQGFGVVAEADRRGGDWRGLAVVGSMIFCVIFPGILGMMTLGIGAIVLRWKPLK